MAFASSNFENLSPDVLRRVTKEIKEIIDDPVEGAKILVNEKDITDVQCIFEGPSGTPYAGGFFRIKLALPKDFPTSPPRGYFLTRIFHPNVAPTSGEICVNTLKKDWKPEFGIRQILLTIKCLLIVPNPESALNEEAGKMLLEHYEEYAKRAKMMTEIHARPPKDLDSHQAFDNSETVVKSGAVKRPAVDSSENATGASASSNGDAAAKKAKERSKKMLKRL